MITLHFGYNQLCTKNLLEHFAPGIYTNPDEVELAFNICRDTLIQEFEIECKRVNTTYRISSFLNTYTALCIETEDADSNNDIYPKENIIGKRLCKNVFSQITHNEIINSQGDDSDKELIERLTALNQSLYELSQEHHKFFLFDKEGFQLELQSELQAFTLIDDNKYETENHFKWNDFKGSSSKNEHLIEFLKAAFNAFGNVFEEFYDLIFNESAPRGWIADITHLFTKYPNNPFLLGLTLKKENANLKDDYHHPYSSDRPRFRPILELHWNGKLIYITTPQLVFEALSEHITNQLPFGTLPREWKSNHIMNKLAKEWKNTHDKWLDDEVQQKLEKNNYLYLRNIKGIDNISLLKVQSSIVGRNIGEIDFIIIDDKNKKLYVTDTKFIKTKSDSAAFCSDKEKFTNGDKPYNEQLFIKYEWIKNNLNHVQNEFKRQRKIVSIMDYTVELFFITNAPTFYSWISLYPIIPVSDLITYVQNNIIK